MKHDLPNFALLIDADNDTPEIIAPVIEEITRDARLSVRRVYGDFTSPHLAKWREALANHGIQPVQQYRNSVGKNATDSALIIDAMDLLHGGRLDGFCLVSSDGDFTRLATRIREDGLSVFGFGRKHAPKAFVSACERYTYVENLGVAPVVGEKEKAATPPVPPGTPKDAGEIPKPRPADPVEAERNELRNLLLRAHNNQNGLRNLLLRAYTNVAGDDGWALVSRIALHLRANHSDFDPRSYGASNFIKLLESSGNFELKQRKQGNGTAHFCLPRQRPMSEIYLAALRDAVLSGQKEDGWTSQATIGPCLREQGRTLEESGCASLTEALQTSGLFEMRWVESAGNEFRLRKSAT